MTDQSGPETNPKKVVQTWLDALMAGDLATMNALYTDDCVIRLPGDPASTPWAGEWTGMEEIGKCFEIIGRTLEIRSHKFLYIIAEGENVVVIGDEVSASKTTGRLIEQTYAWLFQVRNGKICLYQLFEDTAAISAAYV